MNKIFLLSLIIFCFTGCRSIDQERGVVEYGYVIPPENLEKAATFIEKTCEAANPKSDEEGEDLVNRVELTAFQLFGKRVIGIKDYKGSIHFTPYNDLGKYDKDRCDKYLKGE